MQAPPKKVSNQPPATAPKTQATPDLLSFDQSPQKDKQQPAAGSGNLMDMFSGGAG